MHARWGTPDLSTSAADNRLRARMGVERANRLISEGFADLAAFGRPFIANPDLVQRLKTGAPLAEIDWTTVYGSGPKGYSDYPALQSENA
jgi:N-ethylmaleimide reductase